MSQIHMQIPIYRQKPRCIFRLSNFQYTIFQCAASKAHDFDGCANRSGAIYQLRQARSRGSWIRDAEHQAPHLCSVAPTVRTQESHHIEVAEAVREKESDGNTEYVHTHMYIHVGIFVCAERYGVRSTMYRTRCGTLGGRR